MSRTNLIGSGVAWQALNFGFKAVLNLLFIVLISRILGAQVFGQYAILSIIIMFSAALSEAGFGAALVHFQEKAYNLFSTAIISTILFSSILVGIVWVLSYNISSLFDYEITVFQIRFIMISSLLISIGSIYQSLYMIDYQFRVIAIASLSSYIIGNFIIAIPLALSGYGLWSILIGICTKDLINLMVLIFNNRIKFDLRFNSIDFKKLINYSKGLIANRIFKAITTQFDKLLFSKLFTLLVLGFYERALTFVNLPKTLIGSSLDGVLFTTFSKHKNDKDKLRVIYLTAVTVVSFALTYIGLAIIMNSEIIVFLLLGPNWSLTAEIVQVIALSLLFFPYWRFVDTLVRSTKHFKQALVIQIVRFLTMIILVFYGYKFYELQGAVCAIVLSDLICTFISILLCCHILETRISTFFSSQLICIRYGLFLFSIYVLLSLFNMPLGATFVTYVFFSALFSILVFLYSPSFFGSKNVRLSLNLINFENSRFPTLQKIKLSIIDNLK